MDAINYVIPVLTTNVQQETVANYFRHGKIHSGDAISENLNEPTCENVIHKLEIMVNDLCYHNKIDDNNLLDYPSESETCSKVKICSEVQNLEELWIPPKKAMLTMKLKMIIYL